MIAARPVRRRFHLPAVMVLGVALPALATPPRHARGGEPALAAIKHRQDVDLNDGTVRCVAFSPDGAFIAACGERAIHMFEVKTAVPRRRFQGHHGAVNSVAFSPNGKQLASGSADKTIRLWHVDSGQLAKVFAIDAGPQKPGVVTHVAFFPDGKTLTSCTTNQKVTLWDVETGLWEHVIRTTHVGAGCSWVAVAPDGKLCAVCGTRNRREFAGQLSLYKVNSGLQLLWNGEHDGELSATHVAFALDGTKLLSCGHDNAVRIWDVKTGRRLQKLLGPDGHQVMQSAAFTPDGGRVVGVTREGMVRLWAAREGTLLAAVKAGVKNVLGLALSPDGATLAIWGEDRAIQLWALNSQKLAK